MLTLSERHTHSSPLIGRCVPTSQCCSPSRHGPQHLPASRILRHCTIEYLLRASDLFSVPQILGAMKAIAFFEIEAVGYPCVLVLFPSYRTRPGIASSVLFICRCRRRLSSFRFFTFTLHVRRQRRQAKNSPRSSRRRPAANGCGWLCTHASSSPARLLATSPSRGSLTFSTLEVVLRIRILF